MIIIENEVSPMEFPKNLNQYKSMVAEKVARRRFLQQLSAASLAAMASGAPRRLMAEEEPVEHPEPTADACILLWMAGGMAAPETFDPKRYRPYEPGLAVADVLSTFPSIDTNVDSIKICEGLE